ncbi:Txe/YoeB family addiction module toxin [Flavobacteriaceae bacterium]|nr:Txe/YoeB family addiction module toxin [Flavobacteriaceae bacterium]MDC0119589.1 Txe/YoeB family addiction module toxin [Flavobacteriaceae bacterium]
MEVIFSPSAIKELDFWKHSGNKGLQKKISALLVSIVATPYHGIGKPEQLKGTLSGFWSRRISREHRLVYRVNDEKNQIEVISMRFHY